MQDSKYAVFKISDFLDAYQALNDIPGTDKIIRKFTKDRLDDAVVIRLQDLFAEPALHSYASAIGVALSVMPEGPERAALVDVSDYFHEASIEAFDHTQKKLPD